MTNLFGNGQGSLFGDGEDRIPHPKAQLFVLTERAQRAILECGGRAKGELRASLRGDTAFGMSAGELRAPTPGNIPKAVWRCRFPPHSKVTALPRAVVRAFRPAS